MALTPQQVQRLEAVIHVGGAFVCPICRHTGAGALFIHTAPMAMPVWDTDARAVKPGGYAVIAAHCTRCCAMQFFDAQALGLRFD